MNTAMDEKEAIDLAFDIGAKQHAWASETDGEIQTGKLDNTPETLQAFLEERCSSDHEVRVLVEATGVYYLDLALIAHELGAQVMVVNPRAAHHFAKALGQRNKTDKLDAKMLLECLKRMPFQTWDPPSKAYLQLRDYGRFLVQLADHGTATRNRLHALSSQKNSPSELRKELKQMIRSNDKRVARLRVKALALIRADDYLKARFDALVTIKGVADVSAISILCELVAMPPTLTSRACVSHAGLDPRVWESGTSVHKAPRISRQGNKHLRRALFYPALSAGAHDPGATAFKQRLLGRGKKKMQANVAVMRKLLTVAWAMMKDPQPYDYTRLYCGSENA